MEISTEEFNKYLTWKNSINLEFTSRLVIDEVAEEYTISIIADSSIGSGTLSFLDLVKKRRMTFELKYDPYTFDLHLRDLLSAFYMGAIMTWKRRSLVIDEVFTGCADRALFLYAFRSKDMFFCPQFDESENMAVLFLRIVDRDLEGKTACFRLDPLAIKEALKDELLRISNPDFIDSWRDYVTSTQQGHLVKRHINLEFTDSP